MGRASPGQTYYVIARNGSLRRSSYVRLVLFSIFASSFVLITSLVVQRLIYDDWLHQTGSLRIVGTCIAAALTFVFVFRWLQAEAQRRSEMLQRFETIARMNDRIRNALQVIECTTYASAPQATEHVKTAVEAIDEALRGVIEAAAPSSVPAMPPRSARDTLSSKRTSASGR